MDLLKFCSKDFVAIKFGCAIVLVGGVGFFLYEFRNKDILWKKYACFQREYKRPMKLRLQQLDEEDDV